MSPAAAKNATEQARPATFLILPGATATPERLEALRDNALPQWPAARIAVPDYLSRWRGVRGVGAWLEHWCSRNLTPDEEVYVFAFILGTAALPYAPTLLKRARRLVLLRSRYQEGVPRALRRRFGYPVTALLFGRAVADLGKPPFWPLGFKPTLPLLTLIETRATRAAQRLNVTPLGNRELGIDGGLEVAIDHDQAYCSPTLMKLAVEFLSTGQLAADGEGKIPRDEPVVPHEVEEDGRGEAE